MTHPKVLVAMALAVALACGAAGCGDGPGISGDVSNRTTAYAVICKGAADLDIALIAPSGRTLATDTAITLKWTGRECLLPFSFSDVPREPRYGIRVLGGLKTVTAWLTAAEASKPVRLTIGQYYASFTGA